MKNKRRINWPFFVIVLLLAIGIVYRLSLTKSSNMPRPKAQGRLTPANLEILTNGLHLEKINKWLFDSSKITGSICETLNGGYSDFDWLENTIEDEAVLKGVKELRTRMRDNYTSALYHFCRIGDNYYISYSDDSKDFKFSIFNLVKEVQAGSGKQSASIARIDPDGNLVIVDNIETAISSNFKELSFYFSCSAIVGIKDNEVLVMCAGGEGPEDTIGLIGVNMDTGKKSYISYCINPHENMTLAEETDFSYTCYDRNKRKYYSGPLDYNSSLLYDQISDQ